MSTDKMVLSSVINRIDTADIRKRENNRNIDGSAFKDTLSRQMDQLAENNPTVAKPLPSVLKFSNHAVERMTQRGINFTPDQMTKIEQATRKASEKGAKETLIFTDNSALIVSVKNNTVVTVMDKNSLKENVFTNIDSTVMI